MEVIARSSIGASAQNPSNLVPKVVLKTYPGAPRTLHNTHVDDVHHELLAFLKITGKYTHGKDGLEKNVQRL
jgi:hypothetical protein